jgi:hypothetical protein
MHDLEDYFASFDLDFHFLFFRESKLKQSKELVLEKNFHQN